MIAGPATDPRAVLIVEDDESIAELERRVLTRAGLTTRTVGRVKDALALLAGESFLVILLDYQLPDGDPWSVVDAARAHIPRIPVIMVTAMGNETVAAEAVHRGVAEYLRKSEGFLNQLPEVVRRVGHVAQIEDRARRADALFELIADNASDMILTADPDGIITYMSPACRKIVGYEPEEFIGRHTLTIVHPDDRPLTVTERAGATRETHMASTVRAQRKDGTVAWIESHVYVLRDPVTAVVKELVLIARDVTERKKSEDAIGREQAQFAEAQAIAQLGSWEWDVTTGAAHWSTELYRILGYVPGEVPPSYEGYQVRLHPEDREAAQARVQRAARTGEPYSGESRLILPDGTIRHVQARGRLLVDAAGRPHKLVGTMQDITERKLLEDELELRTTELRRSNAELEHFAYAASHDLRAPLRAITELSAWLVEDLGDQLPERPREYLALIRRRVGRMDRLLTDLLDFARVGRADEKTEVVNTTELIDELRQLVSGRSRIVIDTCGELPTFTTARAPLKSVFLNLLDNAIKHHDRPDGRIEIRSFDWGMYHEFTITDDGPGIPPDMHKRVFEMFRTLRPRDQVEGSGLGLSIVQKIVETAGGQITLDSTPVERGATFRFTWPKAWHTPSAQPDSPARSSEF